MTLRTFHFVGMAEFNVTQGLPRLIEIMSGRCKDRVIEVPFKKEVKIEEIKKFENEVRETKLGDICDIITYYPEFTCVKVFDTDIDIDINSIFIKIKEVLDLDDSQISIKENNIFIHNIDDPEKSYTILNKNVRILKNILVKGIKGAKTLFNTKNKTLFIEGVSLKTFLTEITKIKSDIITYNKIISNNIKDIERI